MKSLLVLFRCHNVISLISFPSKSSNQKFSYFFKMAERDKFSLYLIFSRCPLSSTFNLDCNLNRKRKLLANNWVQPIYKQEIVSKRSIYKQLTFTPKIMSFCSNIGSKSSNNTYLNIIKILFLSPCERSE